MPRVGPWVVYNMGCEVLRPLAVDAHLVILRGADPHPSVSPYERLFEGGSPYNLDPRALGRVELILIAEGWVMEELQI